MLQSYILWPMSRIRAMNYRRGRELGSGRYDDYFNQIGGKKASIKLKLIEKKRNQE